MSGRQGLGHTHTHTRTHTHTHTHKHIKSMGRWAVWGIKKDMWVVPDLVLDGADDAACHDAQENRLWTEVKRLHLHVVHFGARMRVHAHVCWAERQAGGGMGELQLGTTSSEQGEVRMLRSNRDV